jgi:transposase InsO family protein
VLFKKIDGDLRFVVPVSLRTQVVRQAHERGHFKVAKTEALLSQDYWMPNVRDGIQKVIRNCIPCILAERKQGRQERFLSTISKGEVRLDTYHINHLGPLPLTIQSYNYVLIVVDAFSKFVWLYETKTTNVAEVLSILKKQSIIFGNPRRIISDPGAAFTSKVILERRILSICLSRPEYQDITVR